MTRLDSAEGNQVAAELQDLGAGRGTAFLGTVRKVGHPTAGSLLQRLVSSARGQRARAQQRAPLRYRSFSLSTEVSLVGLEQR